MAPPQPDPRPADAGPVRFLSPKVTTTFDQAADWYDYATADHFWIQGRLAAMLRLIDDLGLPRQAAWRVLDVGCGNGVFCRQLEDATQWTVDGADLNLAALESARRGQACEEMGTGSEPLRENSGERPSGEVPVPISSCRGQTFYYDIGHRQAELVGAYDAVTLCDVLEHIAAPQEFLAAVADHLRPGGWLLVNVPAMQMLYGLYDKVQGHVRRYNKTSLAGVLAGQGWDVAAMRYWGLTMVPIVALRTLAFGLRRPTESVMRRGFLPPGKLTNRLLRWTLRVELALSRRPPLGTSLLLAARKPGE